MTGPAQARGNSTGRAAYVIGLLALIAILNYYDRYLIGILVEDLKRDLGLSDSQIGLLSGLAFALVYCTAAIPIARYADGGRRVRVLGISAILWSIMTAACGLATGFWTLLVARFGVGVGEAGGLPTTHAITAEAASPRWRATALSVIALAGAAGTLLALAAGGAIAERYGWRMAFFARAVPGIFLALLLLLTVREPQRAAGMAAPEAPPLGAALATLLGRRAFLLTAAGIALAAIPSFGAQMWTPAFLMRHYGLTPAVVGATYSAALAPAMLGAILVGGVLGDWLNRRDARWPLWIIAFSFAIAGPGTALFLAMENYSSALIVAGILAFASGLWVSPSYALFQALSGPRLRATGAAVFLFVINLVGQGLGPLVVGWLSDLLTPAHGADALRLALLSTTAFYPLAAIVLLLAARTARADIAAASDDS